MHLGEVTERSGMRYRLLVKGKDRGKGTRIRIGGSDITSNRYQTQFNCVTQGSRKSLGFVKASVTTRSFLLRHVAGYHMGAERFLN
jgi:hypothetical protein